MARSRDSRTALYFRLGTWTVPALALGAAVWIGLRLEANPADQAARTLAELSLTLLLVDLWALGIALFRKSERTPLRVPVKTPVVLSAVHVGFWLWGRYLVSFDLFYRLEPAGVLGGDYVVRWGTALLLGLVALTSLAAAFFEARLVQWVLISEDTAVGGEPDRLDSDQESDMQLGAEHLYEAQVILHNLGYDVGGIDGEMNASTQNALQQFQAAHGLEQTGEVTVLTMIELRNQWAGREEPPPGQSVKALSEHVARQAAGWMSTWWRQRWSP